MYPDTLVSILIIIILLVGLAGISYFLEKRSKRKGPLLGADIEADLPPPGPLYIFSIYLTRILIALMVLSIIVGLITKSLTPVWIGLALLGLAYIVGWIRRIAGLIGK
jgi:hypothetical protein